MKASLVLVSVAALALAGPAAAKEPIRATICGASGCATVTDKALLREIPGGENTVALGAAAPYYEVTVVNGEPDGATHAFTMYYVPSANGMAWDEHGLVRLHPIYGARATGLMRRLTEGVEPFPAPRVTAAIVGDRRVAAAAAQSYLSLFTVQAGDAAADPPTDWVGIDLRSGRGSPWTDARTDVVFAPGRNLIERGWRWVEVSDELAADIEAARAIGARPERREPRWTLGIAAAAALALLGAFGARTGRRREG